VGARRPFFVMGVLKQVATPQLQKERQLQREVARLVEGAFPDVEVLALELTGKDRFCVFVDHPAGVDHALCMRVTDVLRSYLDQYTVEVSSPGLDRPLRTREHFDRAVGRTVRIRTEKGRARGEVVAAGERAVRIQNAAASERPPVDVSYDEIVRANIVDEGIKGS
jgi:ribosome maturation factor RimP